VEEAVPAAFAGGDLLTPLWGIEIKLRDDAPKGGVGGRGKGTGARGCCRCLIFRRPSAETTAELKAVSASASMLVAPLLSLCSDISLGARRVQAVTLTWSVAWATSSPFI